MKTITIDQKKFNLDGFIKDNIAFIEKFVPCDGYSIPELGKASAAVYHEDFKSRDIKQEVLKGKALYFIFSGYDIYRDVTCIDGKKYSVLEDDDFESDVMVLEEPDTVGYLISSKGRNFVIDSAMETSNFVEFPEIQKHKNFGIFNQPMEKFIKRYCK